jgi:hypothetical protein
MIEITAPITINPVTITAPISIPGTTINAPVTVGGGGNTGGLIFLAGLDNGAGMPGAVLQAEIDARIAAGANPQLIFWTSLGTESTAFGTLAIQNAVAASAAEVVALILSHGVFAIQDAVSSAGADAIALVQSGGALTVADAVAPSGADNITITNPASLVFVVADAVAASAADNVTLTQHGGTLAIADAVAGTVGENVVITVGGGSAVFSDTFDGSGTLDSGKWGTFANDAPAYFDTGTASSRSNNTLKMQINTKTGSGTVWQPTLNGYAPQTGRIAKLKFVPPELGKALRLIGDNGHWIGLLVDSREVETDVWNDFVVLQKYDGSTLTTVDVASGDDGGIWDFVIGTKVEIRFVDATTVTFWASAVGNLNNMIQQGTAQTIPSLGTAFKLAPSMTLSLTGAVTATYFDTAEVW